MGAIASQITSLTIVYSTVYSDADQIKHQSSASLAFVRGIHQGPVNSPHKWPVTRKMFPFDDVFMYSRKIQPDIKVSIGMQKQTSQGNMGKTPTLRTQAYIWITNEINSLRWIFDKVLIWLLIDWDDWYIQNAYHRGKKPALG